MESMHICPRVMVLGDMFLFPTGNMLIINGASKGSRVWGKAQDPIFYPLLYNPSAPAPLWYEVLTPSSTPRICHSSWHVFPDGCVLVGGSNPTIHYNFTSVLYPTDLILHSFSPSFLAHENDVHRPLIMSFSSTMGYDVASPWYFTCKGWHIKKPFLLQFLGCLSTLTIIPWTKGYSYYRSLMYAHILNCLNWHTSFRVTIIKNISQR